MLKRQARTGLFGLVCGLAVAACSQSVEIPASDGVKADNQPVIRTVKPGANLAMASELRFPVSAGDQGTLDVRFEEGYPAGQLRLKATADSDGLELYGPSSEELMDLSTASPKDWGILFTANEDGIHYINILAVIEKDGEPVESRAFAAKILVGDVSAADAVRLDLQGVETQSDGRRVKILPADETRGN